MKLPWKKNRHIDPIEREKKELAELWINEEDSKKRNELIERYIALDNHQLESAKVRGAGGIDAKTLFNGGVTIGLALLTLNFERFDIVRSKVANLWLRRHV